MKIKVKQITKEDTRTEIFITPDDAIQLIQGLASGVRACTLAGWNSYNCGYFKQDKFNSIMLFVTKE